MVQTRDRRRGGNRPHIRRQVVDLRLEYLAPALWVDLTCLSTGFSSNASAHREDRPIGEEDGVDVHALVVQRAFCVIGGIRGLKINHCNTMSSRLPSRPVVFRAAAEDHELLVLRWRQNHTGALVAVRLVGQSIYDNRVGRLERIEHQWRDLMDSTDFAESIRHVGAYSAASEYYESKQSNRYDEMDFRIKGGNTRLVNALAERIGLNAIHTCKEVKEVDQKDGTVTVWTEDNRTELFAPPRSKRKDSKKHLPSRREPFPAAYCICTVPARVLTDIRFHPPLSKGHREAAKELQYARIMKTVVLFENRFWQKKKGAKFSCFTDGTSDFIFDATLGQPPGEGILCSYAIGDKADDLAACGTEELRQSIERDLAPLFPGENTKAVAIERYAWQEDKYTMGAYALYRPGQWFPVRESLSKNLKDVYFAGEHLADEQGFRDGAIDSGEDAAQDILDDYGDHH